MFSSVRRVLTRLIVRTGASSSEKASAWGSRIAVATVAAATGASASLVFTARRRETAEDAYTRGLDALQASTKAASPSASPRVTPTWTLTPEDAARASIASRARSRAGIARRNLNALRGAEATDVDDRSLLYSIRNINPVPSRVTGEADSAALLRETAIVLIAPPAADAALMDRYISSLASAAAADVDGFTYRVLSSGCGRPSLEALFPDELAPQLPYITLLHDYGRTHERFDSRTSTASGVHVYSGSLTHDLDSIPSAIQRLTSDFKAGVLRPTLTSAVATGGLAMSSAELESFLSSPTSTSLCLAAVMHDCPMCMCLSVRVAMLHSILAAALPSVQVRTLDIDANERPRDWLPHSAFPSLHMFNGSSSSPATFRFGPECLHLPQGSTCIPNFNFAHPTSAGRSAMPTVAQLVTWAAATAGVHLDLTVSAVPMEGEVKYSIAQLCDDMEAEAKAFDGAVFELLYWMSLADKYEEYYGSDGDLTAMQSALTTARVQVVDQGGYGAYEAAVAALASVEACATSGGDKSILGRVRARMRADMEAADEVKALAAVQSLLEAPMQ